MSNSAKNAKDDTTTGWASVADLFSPHRWWPWPWAGVAPDQLFQPILPGWSFNINSNNSTAPQTEAQILEHHSYGRQIGRISDVLRDIVRERDVAPSPDSVDGKFLEMCEEIDAIKLDAARARVEQVISDLRALREHSADDYEKLRDALEAALAKESAASAMAPLAAAKKDGRTTPRNAATVKMTAPAAPRRGRRKA